MQSATNTFICRLHQAKIICAIIFEHVFRWFNVWLQMVYIWCCAVDTLHIIVRTLRLFRVVWWFHALSRRLHGRFVRMHFALLKKSKRTNIASTEPFLSSSEKTSCEKGSCYRYEQAVIDYNEKTRVYISTQQKVNKKTESEQNRIWAR